MYVIVLTVYVCMYVCVYCVHGQKRAPDSWDLVLEMVVSKHGGSGTEPWPSGRVTSSLNHETTPLPLHDLRANKTILKIKWKTEYKLFLYYGNYEKLINEYA